MQLYNMRKCTRAFLFDVEALPQARHVPSPLGERVRVRGFGTFNSITPHPPVVAIAPTVDLSLRERRSVGVAIQSSAKML